MAVNEEKKKSGKMAGRLRVGDDWNAITIIALSQNNPLKAIAEFVENSIDAQAANVTIIRGKEKGEHYLKIIDDGNGIPRDEDGVPDFKYVATHICDSLKRKLKREGHANSQIQGEFGIGLLSFWTVGEGLSMVCSGTGGKTYEMTMRKGKPGYDIKKRAHLLSFKGTALRLAPLLAGIRSLNGEKIQRYLASELRDRIRSSGVKIKVVDRVSRMECDVEPREFSGRLLHNMPSLATVAGDIYEELYLCEQSAANQVGLYRNGTRVLPNITSLDEFRGEVWNSGFLQGVLDVSYLTITPGTRDGIIRDEKFVSFIAVVKLLEEELAARIREQQKAEDERASRNILKSVQTALREAIMDLPPEEYDWFDLYGKKKTMTGGEDGGKSDSSQGPAGGPAGLDADSEVTEQKQFFEFAGPLFSAKIYPSSTLVSVSRARLLRAIGMDKSRRTIDSGLAITWSIAEGIGVLDKAEGEIVQYIAPNEPGLVRVKAVVRQGTVSCEAECFITVVDSLIEEPKKDILSKKGLPGYTLESARGSMWRSRYDEKNNVIVINSGHRDFVFASRNKLRKVRYISRLFSKELVSKNFAGLSANDMMERLIELSLYTEEKLRP